MVIIHLMNTHYLDSQFKFWQQPLKENIIIPIL